MQVQIGEYNLSDSLELTDDRVVCKDCQRWEYANAVEAGRKIKHSNRCDLNAQPTKNTPKPIKRDRLAQVAEQYKQGSNVDFNDIFQAYQAGHISASDAMNSDF